MRSALTFISILAALAVGSASCRKSEANTLVPGAAVTRTTGTGVTEQTSTLNFSLYTLPAANTDCVHWDGGYVMVNEAGFSGSISAGNCIRRQNFALSVGARKPLFSPAAITSLPVVADRYFASIFRLTLMPGDEYALLLTGSCVQHMSVGGDMGIIARTTAAMQVMPVQFRVPDPVTLAASLPDSINLNQPAYDVVLTLNPSALLQGVSPVMMDNATAEAGTLVISPTANRGIYDIMVANLANAMSAELVAPGAGISR